MTKPAPSRVGSSMPMRREFLMTLILAPALATKSSAEELATPWPEGAGEADLDAAYSSMAVWIEAYRAQDFATQWRMTDPRIRRWIDRRRWMRGLGRAFSLNGNLVEHVIANRAALGAERLPCTEQGHCFRPDVPYVIFFLRTRYEIAAPPQPEFCVMARSSEGWRFGGGTLLNRPLGETAVIMTPQDERRYEFRGFSFQQ